MKTVFVAKRNYDRAGYDIVGIFLTNCEAEKAINKDKENGYGEFHTIAELEVGKYFDIDKLDA